MNAFQNNRIVNANVERLFICSILSGRTEIIENDEE
jgi:hypothetical protein